MLYTIGQLKTANLTYTSLYKGVMIVKMIGEYSNDLGQPICSTYLEQN